jgi:hypothetical protein
LDAFCDITCSLCELFLYSGKRCDDMDIEGL